MFVLGISLKDKEDQQAVYPRVGPIFGYFEIGSLVTLLITGTLMIINNGLIDILFDMTIHNIVIDAFRPRNTTYVLLIKYLKNGGTYVQVNIRTEELFEFINRVFEKKNMIMGMKQTPSKVKL